MLNILNSFPKNNQFSRVKYLSTKVFDGFSTCFRQWKAKESHCQFLHGYGISFKVWFEGELDERNWVWDFGGMKRAETHIEGMTPQEWMDYMFDHTVIVAKDDPNIDEFYKLEEQGVIQLRVVPEVSAEKFAKLIFEKLNDFIIAETQGRVRVKRVEFMEHNRNSAIVEV